MVLVSTLPDEIWSLICAELGQDRDFASLFNVARTSRSLADASLRMMYRFHELSPAFTSTDDDVRQKHGTWEDSQQYFKLWMLLWRSIIMSTFPSATYKPYCRYLRILDFRNLAEMLESERFRSVKRSFYAKPLSGIAHMRTNGKYEYPDLVATLNDVGERVVPQAALLEEISGHLRPGYLTRWALQTPRLKRMTLWRGDALGDDAGQAIADKCEDFDSLSIMTWLDSEADMTFSTFLSQLRPNSLKYLEVLSHSNLSLASFQALHRHDTLKELRLSSLSTEAMENLNGLMCCKNIETLLLEDGTGAVRLEELNNDVYSDVIQWLSTCTKLRDVTIKRFFDGASILAAVLIAPEVKLFRLCLEGYTVRNNSSASFHAALADQKYLESLFLAGNGEDTHPHDLEIMVSSICQLSNLKELILRSVSDEFDMTHISNLVLNLPLLEDFWTSGQELSSDVLPLLANLRSLRNLTLYALTQFDLESLFDFVNRLDAEKQKGFNLSLMAVDQDFALTEDEQKIVTDALSAQVGGRFGKL